MVAQEEAYEKKKEEYLKHIRDAGERSQAEFDKTLISLSGGALGISLIFITDIVNLGEANDVALLKWSWILWASSLIITLFSFYTSVKSTRKMINDLSSENTPVKMSNFWMVLTQILNILSPGAFICGVILFMCFVSTNI